MNYCIFNENSRAFILISAVVRVYLTLILQRLFFLNNVIPFYNA